MYVCIPSLSSGNPAVEEVPNVLLLAPETLDPRAGRGEAHQPSQPQALPRRDQRHAQEVVRRRPRHCQRKFKDDVVKKYFIININIVLK